MTSRRTKLAGLMALTIAVLCLTCPLGDSDKESSDGHFLSPYPSSMVSEPDPSSASSTADPSGEPFRYEQKVVSTDDGPVVMHLLEIDLKSERVGVKPVTSHRTLFGYEYLSVMAENTQALAAVNGGFSHPNGLPGGMIYANEILKTPASGRFPVLFLFENGAVLADATQRIWLQSDGRTLGEAFYNYYSVYGGIYVFTPVYGSGDRIEKRHLCAVVREGKVSGLTSAEGPVSIPSDGFLVSAVGVEAEKRLRDFITIGGKIELMTQLETSPPLDGEYVSAYECGSWLIRDGVNVCPQADAWVGNLLTRAPRTAVGIKSDGTLLLAVVDGRDMKVSIGASGPELAELLLGEDVRQAAMLDGGASSEMIVEGEIVSHLSAGRERLISSCLVVFEKGQQPLR